MLDARIVALSHTPPVRQEREIASSGMTSIWVESLGRNFESALDLLQAAAQDCTDELWEMSMWPVRRGETPSGSLRGPDGIINSDPAVQDELSQRFSAPWLRAWHALEVLDYDLAGKMEAWKPPAHRYRGQPYAYTLTSLPGHTIEHAAQIRQFTTFNRALESRGPRSA